MAPWPPSTDLSRILATPTFTDIGDLVAGTTWRPPTTGTLQHKGFDIAEGFTNTPWHRDCGPGGHSYKCCVLRAGISLTADHDGTGRFGAIAGSHRANISANPLLLPEELPKHLLTCEPGDVHLHLSCTFHRGTAATTAHRRVVYADFLLPGAESVDNDSAYRDGTVSAAVGGAVAASAALAGGTP